MNRLGIIGGLGPETSCNFCLSLNNKFRQITDSQPDITLENIPVSGKAEHDIINGDIGEEHFKLLSNAVKRLNRSGVDFIVVPCNKVHAFINELRNLSKKPILSIVEVCGEECERLGFSKVGLLGSTKTITDRLHSNELKRRGIESIFPEEKAQKKISKIIIKIIHNTANKNDILFLHKTITDFKERGAQAVVLACTDLPLIISKRDSCLPIINTLEILENSSVNCMLGRRS